jgi:membrane protein required for colicin V production
MSYLDIVVGAIILLLGLKGILNGFFRELFGLVGIVGGVFVASHFGSIVGEFIGVTLLNLQNKAAISFTGFVLTLGIFWLIMIGVGITFRKLSIVSGLGSADKILGFAVGAGKFFMIASVVAYSFYNIKIVRTNMQESMEKSTLFPLLITTGSYIMKLDSTEAQQDANATLEEKKSQMQEKVEDAIKGKVKKDLNSPEAIKSNVQTALHADPKRDK